MNDPRDGTGSISVADLKFIHYLQPAQIEHALYEDRANTALVILNCPISDIQYLECLHAHAAFTLCADGGANRVYDLIHKTYGKSDQHDHAQATLRRLAPDAIHGDLDSLRDDVRKTYETLGVVVSRDPDQYSTDFGKALVQIKRERPNVSNVLVLGSIGGRVDQGIGLLHELLREQKYKHPDVRLWLFTESSVTVLLRPGRTIIETPLGSGVITRNVGILPLYGRAVITLKGFEWDVTDWPTELGGQVSTSNHIFEDQLQVTTDREVLFTVQRHTSKS